MVLVGGASGNSSSCGSHSSRFDYSPLVLYGDFSARNYYMEVILDMIYTSYYANHRKYKGMYRIAISRIYPINSCDLCIIKLAPSHDLLRDYKANISSQEDYTTRYIAQLDVLYNSGKLDLFVNKIKSIESDIVLLCYEKPSDFCHRHILAEYLNNKYFLSIKEL